MIFGTSGTEAAMLGISVLGAAEAAHRWFKTKAPRAAAMVGYYVAFGMAAVGVLSGKPVAAAAGVLLMIPMTAFSAYLHHRAATGDTSPIHWPGVYMMGALGFMNFACLVAGVFFGASGISGRIDLSALLTAFTCFFVTFSISRRLRDADFRERLMRPADAAAHLAEAQALKDSLALRGTKE